MHNKENNTRLIVCISVLIVISTFILDRLVPEGIFLDGATYASISRNMAIGKGTFWSPYYRNEWPFSEHPPLMFGIQAIFFKIFGDHYLTEKIYSFFIWILTAAGIRYLWNSLVADKEVKYSYALPLLAWCIIPTVTWGYTNNILDTTMCLFDMLAVICLYKACAQSKGRIVFLLVGGICTTAALLTKGPVGAFPLAVPFVYWLVYAGKNIRSFVALLLQTIIPLAIIGLIFLIIYQSPAAQEGLGRYIKWQLLSALSGNREITGGGLGRWALLIDILIQLAPAIGIAIILFIISKISKVKAAIPTRHQKAAWFFLLIGICGSLPILMSVKQRTFYLVPSLPYYVLAICAILYPLYILLTGKKEAGANTIKYFRLSAVIVSIGLMVYLGSKIGQPGRDKELLSDIKFIGTIIPQGEKIGVCLDAEYNYEFLAYLQRYNRMEATWAFYTTNYTLADKTLCGEEFSNVVRAMGFKQLPINSDKYELFQRRFPLHFDFILLNPAFRRVDK